MPIDDDDSGLISDRALQSWLQGSRDEDAAREAMRELPQQRREELIRYWRRAGRLDELPSYYTWLIRKFHELRRARPLEDELTYALGEFVDIDAQLSPSDAAHVYVLSSAAWTDFEAELKRQLLAQGDEEAYELFLRRLFELGVDVGIYLQQQPLSPYFEGTAQAAHEFAFRAFQTHWYRPE